MKLFLEFRNSWQRILREKGAYSIIFLQLLIFSSNISFLNTNEALVINGIILFFLAFQTKKVNFIHIFVIVIVFLILNLLTLISGGHINIELISGYLLRIVSAYFLILIYGKRLYFILENLIFVLVFISIPLFVIQLIAPQIFDIFNIINFSTERRLAAGHINFFVFNYNAWALQRNSGFMGEPAVFGLIITWSYLIYLWGNRFKLDIRGLVYFVGLISTVSMGAYTYILLLLLTIGLNTNKRIATIAQIVIPIVFIIWAFVPEDLLNNQNEMIQKKVKWENKHIDDIQAGYYSTDQSRVGGALIGIDYFLKQPLGYGLGIDRSKNPYLMLSPNGLIKILNTWGIPGLLIVIIGLYRSFRYVFKLSKVNSFLFLSIFLMTLFGNPVYNDIPMFVFILNGYLIKL